MNRTTEPCRRPRYCVQDAAKDFPATARCVDIAALRLVRRSPPSPNHYLTPCRRFSRHARQRLLSPCRRRRRYRPTSSCRLSCRHQPPPGGPPLTSPGRKPQERKVPVSRVYTRRLAAGIAVFIVAAGCRAVTVAGATVRLRRHHRHRRQLHRRLQRSRHRISSFPSLPPPRWEDVTPERH